jgi:hypothetical protein
MVPDVFIGSALELDGDEREWLGKDHVKRIVR